MPNPNGINGHNSNGRSSKYADVESSVCEWYSNGEPLKDIVNAHGLTGEKNIYDILHKHNIPLRNRKITNVDLTPPPTPRAPKREWFLIDECAAILDMKTEDIEWLIHRGMVQSDEAKTVTGGKFTLVLLPSLIDAQKHASIDGKRAKQLLSEAWTMLDKVARQKSININDANFICGAIHDFFVANGWTLK